MARVESDVFSVFAPPLPYTVSQWADEFMRLSAESSAEPGRYRVDRAPYQRGMLDAVSDPACREIVYCTSSQIGKTLMQLGIIGYYMHHDPAPMLMMQPTVSIAEAFSKDRFAPMVRDTPALTGLMADPKSRKSSNTITHKAFVGGHITMIGSNAPSELASRPIRILLADEVDRYPPSAGTEGDPLFLARQRTVTFWNRKLIMASTPTILGTSRIWRAYESSDQRRYYLPCPHCGEYHILRWPQVHWDAGDPSSAHMACPVCGGLYTDADKLKMLAAGEWRAATEFHGSAGFHISSLYSPWQSFADVVKEWLDKKDHTESLKTFVNLQLGECWEDREGEAMEPAALMARREAWAHVPEDVIVITAGVDVQDDRIEISVIGWTQSDQARVLHHFTHLGSPGEPAVWHRVDETLMDVYSTEDGRDLMIRAACVDTGGHHTQQAYAFCGPRRGRKVMAIKGMSGARPIWNPRASRSALVKRGALFMVGVDTAKDSLRSALAVKAPHMPRYVAFSSELPDDYFRQLLIEKRITTYKKSGQPERIWRKPAGTRNEALDCFVYGLAALEMLKVGGMRLRAVTRQPPARPKPVEAEPQRETPRPTPRPTPAPQRGFARAW